MIGTIDRGSFLRAALVLSLLVISLIGPARVLFWPLQAIDDNGGVILVFALFVSIAFAIEVFANRRGAFYACVALIAATFLTNSYGRTLGKLSFPGVELTPSESKPPIVFVELKGNGAGDQAAITDADIVFAAADVRIEPGVRLKKIDFPSSLGNLFISERFSLAQPVIGSFGQGSANASIASLIDSGGNLFSVGVVYLPNAYDEKNYTVSRITARRVATKFRHLPGSSIIIGNFNTSAYAYQCRIFAQVGLVHHAVLPSLMSLWRAPFRKCVDEENILLSNATAIFEPQSYNVKRKVKIYPW